MIAQSIVLILVLIKFRYLKSVKDPDERNKWETFKEALNKEIQLVKECCNDLKVFKVEFKSNPIQQTKTQPNTESNKENTSPNNPNPPDQLTKKTVNFVLISLIDLAGKTWKWCSRTNYSSFFIQKEV